MRFDLPEHRKLVHEMVIPMRWGDMDAMGHVNNTVYFRYMESVRVEWLDSLARGQTEPPVSGPVVVNAFCNFLLELRYPGDLRVRMFAARPGRTSFETYYEIALADKPDAVHANGGAKVVWIDFAQRRSVALPEALRGVIGD